MSPALDRPSHVRVRVPATSANLGPGFDAFGLALQLHDHVEVAVTSRGLDVEVEGEGSAELPRDAEHLVVRAILAAFDRIGWRPPGLALRCRNEIPQGRGLGSSAAAIVAGVVAAQALAVEHGELDEAATLRLCAELEGHPDNVAACLLGGLTLAWTGTEGADAVRLPVAGGLRMVALVSPTTVSTDQVRRLLPTVVPYPDAVSNAARAALLVEALGRRPDLLLVATEDRLHQAYRASAMPQAAALLRRLRATGIAAVISGAGPSVLAFAAEPADVSAPDGWVSRPVQVDLDGAVTSE